MNGIVAIVLSATLALDASTSPVSAPDWVPAERQALMLIRALGYDSNLASRAGDSVAVAVLYKAGNTASERMANTVAQAFKSLEAMKVQGIPLRALMLPYRGPPPLAASFASDGIDALYICSGLEGDLGPIKEASRRGKVLTIASKTAYVEDGLSLGVFLVDAKSTILINLAASRGEGAAFASDLLRVAKVIR